MKRTRWIALVLGLAMPGLGQIYNGELVKGISYYLILLAINAAGIRWTVLLPDRWLAVGILFTVAATIVMYALAIADGYRKSKLLENSYQPAQYNRWYFYVAVWLLGSVLIPGAVFSYAKNNFLEAYKVSSGSMEPGVLKGDRILADKTAYERMSPKKGDIVIFVFPDDRSKRFIKRVEGLPGDTVSFADGSTQKTPHGFIYVLGDNRENSQDSRHFGFVPLSDVIGKARQVYFSSGEDGIRWNRIGATLSATPQ
jgi:signal peptidase I